MKNLNKKKVCLSLLLTLTVTSLISISMYWVIAENQIYIDKNSKSKMPNGDETIYIISDNIDYEAGKYVISSDINSLKSDDSFRSSGMGSRLKEIETGTRYGESMGYHPDFTWNNAKNYYFSNSLRTWNVNLKISYKDVVVAFSYSQKGSPSGWISGDCDSSRQNRPLITADYSYKLYERTWYPLANPNVVDHVDYVTSINYQNKWVYCSYK